MNNIPMLLYRTKNIVICVVTFFLILQKTTQLSHGGHETVEKRQYTVTFPAATVLQ